MKYMKNIAAVFVLAGLMAASVFAEEETVNESEPESTEEITVTVNGEEVIFKNAKPMIKDGRTLVPFRAIFDALGAEVDYTTNIDERVETVTAEKNGVVLTMVINDVNYTITTDGELQNKEMDAAPEITNGSTYIPARYGAEAFGYEVNWDDDTHTVIITGEAVENEDETGAEAETEAVSEAAEAEPETEETTEISMPGYTYTGPVNEDGLPNGNGVMDYTSGDKYEGDFVNGVKEGEGTYYFSSGNVYSGSWVNDGRQGTGTMTWYKTDENNSLLYDDNGEKIKDYEYEGEWESGNIQGTGTMVFYDDNGEKIKDYEYEGEWENNTFIGEASEEETA